MNLYEDIYTDIEDIFTYQKKTNDKFVNPKHIGALFCYYTEFDDTCYEMVSYLGKYKVKILKEHEEKIKAYVAEHPEK